MKSILRVIKKFLLWSYARNTWQWDVLCVVILAFIFLTPKSWFVNSELHNLPAHQSQLASTIILGPEVAGNKDDRSEIERRVRVVTNRSDAEVVAVRERRDPSGKLVALEVDIR